MAIKRTPAGGEHYKENHGEDSKVSGKITKGAYFQVGTVMPMTETAVSVNKKEPGHERGE